LLTCEVTLVQETLLILHPKRDLQNIHTSHIVITHITNNTMASAETKVINKVRKMLLKGPDHCFNAILKFSGLVTQLEAHAWSLSTEQNQFLNCLIRLREEMVADAPFIFSIKEDIEQNRRAMWYILREICSLKEEIEIYEGNLATLSHEEKTIIYQTHQF
jgi:hypothetical protein